MPLQNLISGVVMLLMLLGGVLLLLFGLRKNNIWIAALGIVIAISGFFLTAKFMLQVDIVTLSAFASIVLAIFAGVQLWNNRELRRENRELRQLNDVIDWAKDICKHSLTESLGDSSKLPGSRAREFLIARRSELDNLRLLRAMSVRSIKITNRYPTINSKVMALTNEIREQIKFLYQFNIELPSSDNDLREAAVKASNGNEKLYNGAVEVIESVSELY
ncbi:hypothetical protein ACFLWN_04890 [Chloroflexota bacterium]